MSFDTDLEHDFAAVTDGLETVQFQRRGSDTTTSLSHALRRAVQTREADTSGGRYTTADVVWHLEALEFTEALGLTDALELAAAPLPGDVIQDASGASWTILDIESATRGTRWRCVCRRLTISEELDTRIAIQVMESQKGPHGEPVLTWCDWRTGVRARVQPLEASVAMGHERRLLLPTHRVYLAEPLELDHTHRVVHDGMAYQIVSVRQPERIDALMELDVLQVPWPLATPTRAV